ncbi:MAG: hypothetical protein ACFE8L_08720 [Candidatus Hodarchaeota archaeon]
MTLYKRNVKNCADCNQSLTFEEFCQINPSISRKMAKKFWNDTMILIYCPDCYFNRPERPFKKRRGYYYYSNRFRNKI